MAIKHGDGANRRAVHSRLVGNRSHDVARTHLQLASRAHVELGGLAALATHHTVRRDRLRSLPLRAVFLTLARRMTLLALRGHRNLLHFLTIASRRARGLLHRRRRDVQRIELRHQRRHHGAPRLEPAFQQQLAQRFLRLRLALRLHVRHRRQRHDFNRTPRHALEVAQVALLTRLGQRDGHTGAPSATRTANAMHIRFRRRRDIVIHHVRDMLHIESARRDIRCHEQLGALRAETLHYAITLFLGEPAMQRLGAIPLRLQRLGHFVHFGTRAAEDDRARRLLVIENPSEGGGLVCAANHVRDLPHLRDGAGLYLFGVNLDHFGIAQMRARNRRNARGEGRREERDLLVLWRVGENRFEILSEAHVEHFVRFVQHHRAEMREMHRLAADVVERASRRGDDDIDAALQRADLPFHRGAAVDRHCNRAARMPVSVEGLGHLHRQFARRHENQGARALTRWRVRTQICQQWQREGRRLAGSSRRLREHVASGEEWWDGRHLNWRRFFVAEGREGGEGLFRKAERGEPRAGYVSSRRRARRH